MSETEKVALRPQPEGLKPKEVEEKYADLIRDLDLEELKVICQSIAYLRQALQGKIPDADEVEYLINRKDPMERSYLPTFHFVARQVTLRLYAQHVPEAEAVKELADLEAKAMISYKGLGREQYVNMRTKGPQEQEGPINIISSTLGQIQPQKRRFWQRKPKPEQSEFEE